MYERYKRNLEIRTIMNFCFDFACSILLKYEDNNDYVIFLAKILYVNNRLLL